MRVLLVDPAAFHPADSARLAGDLARAGATVHLAVAPSPREAWPDVEGCRRTTEFAPFVVAGDSRWPALRRLRRALDLPRGWNRVGRRVAEFAPDVVHLLWSLAPRLEARALAALGRRGVATAVTVHNARRRPGEPWHPAGLAALCRAAGALIAPSRATADDLVAVGFAARERAHVVVPPLPAVEILERGRARRELGLPADAPIVLCFGIVREYKGLAVMVEALRRLVDRHPDVLLLVAGPATTARARDLRRAIARAGVEPRVRLELEWLEPDRAARAFAAADVVALPYLEATQSGVGWRALAHERAVVASAVGGLAELIGEDRERLLVPPRDAPALADTLASLLADRAATDGVGRRLAERARAERDPARAAAALLDAYRAAGGGRR
jgi:glycosyltransferase involved in cell wall biosynthesis